VEVAAAQRRAARADRARLAAAPAGVTAPIVGATKIEQLDQAVGRARRHPDDEEARRLEEPYVPHTVLGIE
jgi:aryl-alcohol dehydrogenase-like predicted oxidoreductase